MKYSTWSGSTGGGREGIKQKGRLESGKAPQAMRRALDLRESNETWEVAGMNKGSAGRKRPGGCLAGTAQASW